MAQWRSHSPAIPPPLPRGLSYSSGTDQHQNALRKASSSRQLRQANVGYSRAVRAAGVDGGAVEYLDGSPDSGSSEFKYGRQRGDSAASTISRTTSESGAAHSRSRSASNPQMYVLPPHMQAIAPPVPRAAFGNGLVETLKGDNTSASSLSVHQHGTSPPTAVPSGPGDKRCSNSSISTSESGQSGQSRPPSSTAASSPVNYTNSTGSASSMTLRSTAQRQQQNAPSSQPTTPTHNSSAIKLIVHFGEDKYVVVVLTSISFVAMLDKVTKKIRVCSGKHIERAIRMRYVDEDGDNVMMNDDDDVQMAFEAARATGEVDILVN
jgi:cell division control protein 24